MAPEFYDTLASHNSWTMVMINFLFDPQIAPQSRVARSYDDHKKGRKMVAELKDRKSDSAILVN